MKVTFTQPTQHDAKVFMPGDKADLPNAAAKALIDCGSAEATDSAKEAKARAEAEAAAKEAMDKAERARAEAEERAQAEKAALAAWDDDAELREQHGNDFAVYMASLVKAD